MARCSPVTWWLPTKKHLKECLSSFYWKPPSLKMELVFFKDQTSHSKRKIKFYKNWRNRILILARDFLMLYLNKLLMWFFFHTKFNMRWGNLTSFQTKNWLMEWLFLWGGHDTFSAAGRNSQFSNVQTFFTAFNHFGICWILHQNQEVSRNIDVSVRSDSTSCLWYFSPVIRFTARSLDVRCLLVWWGLLRTVGCWFSPTK